MTPQPNQEIIRAARDIMERRYVPGKHCIGAAIRTRTGRVFVGVHVEAGCGRIAVCAEAIAIGVAATNGDTDIDQIVAVTESGEIVPPCGMCRELISDYAPDARVILPLEGVPRKLKCCPRNSASTSFWPVKITGLSLTALLAMGRDAPAPSGGVLEMGRDAPALAEKAFPPPPGCV